MLTAGRPARPCARGASALLDVLCCVAVLSIVQNAIPQGFPAKPIRVLASEAGGSADVAARIIAQGLSAYLEQPVIVENRGGGTLAGEAVARAAPDGHTLLFYGNTLWLMPLMRSHVPYDPQRDFAPVSLAV